MRVSRLPAYTLLAFVLWCLSGFAYQRLDTGLLSPHLKHAASIVSRLTLEDTKPRIIVIGGSTALHEIVASRIEAISGVSSINAAITNEMFSHANLFHYAELLARKGDVIIYQSPALLGLDNESTKGASEGDYFARGLGLPLEPASYFGSLTRYAAWVPVPRLPPLVSVYRYTKEYEKADRSTLIYSDSEILAWCETQPKAAPIRERPVFREQYFTLLSRFNKTMSDKNVRVLYLLPTLLVPRRNLTQWREAVSTSVRRIELFGGDVLETDPNALLSHEPALFCDSYHVRRAFALALTKRIGERLRTRGVGPSPSGPAG